MPEMNFAHFHGAVPKFQQYVLSAQQDILYIVPEAETVPRRYDPFEDSEGLLLDVVRAGAAVADCGAFMDYCLSHKMLPLRDTEFWQGGDFFTACAQEAQPVLDMLLYFAGRYGLPVWDMVTTIYPAQYAQQAMALHQDEEDDTAYMLVYEATKRACATTGAVPVCTLALALLDFYLRFIEGVGDRAFAIHRAEWVMDYGQEKTPRLTAQVYDLTTCINLAYARLVSGEGKAVRQCKHCQRFFIAEDLRAEYCSPRCRGAYNSKMTRKRVKERKLREGQ